MKTEQLKELLKNAWYASNCNSAFANACGIMEYAQPHIDKAFEDWYSEQGLPSSPEKKKPLSELTEEDALFVASILEEDYREFSKENMENMGRGFVSNLNAFHSNFCPMDAIHIYQYLQSRGYELPVYYK